MLAIFTNICPDPPPIGVQVYSAIESLNQIKVIVKTSKESNLDEVKYKYNSDFEFAHKTAISLNFEIKEFIFS